MAEVVEPTGAQLIAVARLRHLLSGGSPADEDDFVGHLVPWLLARRESHVCRAVVDGETVVGFGFLAITARVPGPSGWSRWSGDIQTVMLAEDHRGAGLGTRLIAALVETARQRGLEHVTVHTNERAASLYLRAGFVDDPLLLALRL